MNTRLSSLLVIALSGLIFVIYASCSPGAAAITVEHQLCNYSMLNKVDAKEAVTSDRKEGYFERVTPLEMSIQMRKPKFNNDRDAILKDYKQFLQRDLANFTAEERKFLQETFDKALDMCASISPNLNLPDIKLIKTEGEYYGPGTYYTRDECIIIPAPQLRSSNSRLLRTMIHEIFHVYSRFNPEKRDALYATIGYKDIPDVQLNELLKNRIIYNPDGVDISYAIEVMVDSAKGKFWAIPAIYSKFSGYQKGVPFGAHFIYQLFEVKEEDGQWKVVGDVGYDEKVLKNYWEQIGKNTTYTIHPDEVLAENFVFLARTNTIGKHELRKFSPEGKELLKKIEKILKE